MPAISFFQEGKLNFAEKTKFLLMNIEFWMQNKNFATIRVS